MSLLAFLAFVVGLPLGGSNRRGVCDIDGDGAVKGERKWPAHLLRRFAGGSPPTIAAEPQQQRMCVFSYEPNVGFSRTTAIKQ